MSEIKTVPQIREYPSVFSALTVCQLASELLESRESHLYPTGVELFHQGNPAVDVYFVEDGLIKLIRAEESGHEIILDLRFRESLVGAAAAIQNSFHAFSAVTATACKLIRVNAQQFRSLLAEDASLSSHVNEILSGEVLNLVARISQIACLPARQRLEHFLWHLCEESQNPSESNLRLQLPLKHYELAELLSITPTYLCRLLNALETESVICRRNGWIVISKPAGLWHILDA